MVKGPEELGLGVVASITGINNSRIDILANNAAPEQVDNKYVCIAFKVVAVSSNVSPFLTDEPATAMLRTEPQRLAASSNDTAGFFRKRG